MSDHDNNAGAPGVTTAPKPFVFVLMPFKPEFRDIYKFGIKGAAEAVGAYAERVDEQHFEGGMLDRIYNQINKADVLVADMTGQNANVFYEVGYAHALNKLVILLTQKSDDIPFDLKHHQHVVYGGEIDRLRSQLEAKLVWAIEQARTRPGARSGLGFEISFQGMPLLERSRTTERPLIHLDRPYGNRISDSVITVRNGSNAPTPAVTYIYLLLGEKTKVEVGKLKITPTESGESWEVDPFPKLDVGADDRAAEFTQMYRCDAVLPPIPPHAAAPIEFTISASRDFAPEPIRLRLCTDSAVLDYDFLLGERPRP